MRHPFALLATLLALPLAGPVIAQTPNTPTVTETLLLTQPAVSERHLAFVYARDLWVANRDGSNVRRLTTHPGREAEPHFSPDGRMILFQGEYDGNIDLFTIPVEGGSPKRLTWHPGPDFARGFTPDGQAILFASDRQGIRGLVPQLFKLPLAGGLPERLPLPMAMNGTYSADGKRLAYSPLPPPHRQWKNYRGGTAARIRILDVATLAVTDVPQPAGRSNDTHPMWLGSVLYFLSDRDGEINLYRFDGRQVSRLTQHTDFPILSASIGAGRIVYEQAGALHLLDPASGKAERLRLVVPADLPEIRPRFASKAEFLRDMALSPSGARAALEYRGEIVTVPAEKGDPRNLTRTSGAHERSPVWSPDGKTLAYFSDASGEYELHLAAPDGRSEPKRIPLGGAGFYELPRFAPDGKKLALRDNSRTLWIIETANGKATKVDSEPYYSPLNTLTYDWSPDSRWLAYTRLSDAGLQTVRLYSLESGQSHDVSGEMADAGEPVFDAGGKYLWFLASTDAGPLRTWFAQSNSDDTLTNVLYLAVLAKDEPSPFAKESDEEKGTEPANGEEGEASKGEDGKGKNGKNKDGKGKDEKDATKDETPRTVIDLEGLADRILAAPVGAAGRANLQAGAAGEVYFLSQERTSFFAPGGPPELKVFRLKDRKEESLGEGVVDFRLAPGGKKLLARQGESLLIVDAGSPLSSAKGPLALAAVQVRVDPRAEWAQIYHEAWRINRDYFYDPNMHGADWPALRKKYEAFLPHLATRDDLNRVIQWLSSELAVGHHNVGGGDQIYEPKRVRVGLLGADYTVDAGRYRFARVYGGLNWDPELRAPLTAPGVDVKAGEYLLEVERVPIAPPESLYARFEGTVGQRVEITVGPTPDGKGSRKVIVEPTDEERNLRYRSWVEDNRKRVEEASQGRIAYVYAPDTGFFGHVAFKRYFFPQTDRQAVLVDERMNGGGQVADYYIDLLRRPYVAHWATRHGRDLRTPQGAFAGPKALLIDELAGSGGDLFPWMWRKYGLGPLIGRATWGGLVGILGFPVLLDGGQVTAPDIGIWTEEGFIVENVGVPPDIEVEMTPADFVAGRDPQLERGIEYLLGELAKNPPQEPKRPPFPIRVRKP